MGFSVGVLSESLRNRVKPARLPLCMGLQSQGSDMSKGMGSASFNWRNSETSMNEEKKVGLAWGFNLGR